MKARFAAIRRTIVRRWGWSTFTVLLIVYWFCLPSKLFERPMSTVLVDESGVLLAAKIADDGQWRFPEMDSVPYKFKTCLLEFEDAFFYRHPGVNPVALYHSLIKNIKASRARSGGSTLTMQLARMARGNRSRTYFQKLVEIFFAVRIELSYKKESILNLYCNHAPFGSNVVGVQAASWRYFGRGPEQLSWSESALLAVLPNAPSLMYPGKNSERLLQKRNRLLRKLYTDQIIDEATFRLSLLEPLPSQAFAIPQLAPHLLARCISEHGKGGRYESTLKASLQEKVNELLNRQVQSLSINNIHNACAIVCETESGRVLAYVGNSSSKFNDHENYVDVIRAPRSTGSILKPFLYAFMLSENKMLPASLLEDVPTRIGSYGPKNFGLTFDGLVPAHVALARSLNVPAVKMLMEYGTAKFHQRLKQLGFTSFSKPTEHYGLSLILGGGEANLWEVAGAYASMGRALCGYNNRWKTYLRDNYVPLNYLKTQQIQPGRHRIKSDLISASALYFTFKAMTELLRPTDYVGWRQFLSKSQLSWKTGTSFGFRDAWAVGLNSKYTVAVWVGNADGEGRPELTGSAAAAPLLFSIFNVLRDKAWFQKPLSELELVEVCSPSGYKASEMCELTDVREYPRGSSKTKPCPFHQVLHLDESEQYRVNSNCYPVAKMKHRSWFVASPVQEHYYRQHAAFYKPMPPLMPGCGNEQAQRQLEIMYPRDGFQVYVPVVESGEKSRCILKATHKRAAAKLFWYLDGDYIGSTEKFHQLSILPGTGQHRLEIVDEDGESAVCGFEVLSKQG